MDLKKKKLGCLHAHYSNIEYIEKALSSYEIELIHFVDPALMHRVTLDKTFSDTNAQNKVKEQIEWIAESNVDAILITCTNYIAILQVEQLSISVPIIKIDEPYFEYICNLQQPQTILFTNPATVEGTMERLNQYAYNHQKSLDIEINVISNTFDLIMRGQKEEYNREISKVLNKCMEEGKFISVAQLSMVDAAKEVEYKTSSPIINPLDTLISSVVNQLKL
ncbi:aspartate/glutamate racemase family protein [Terribacillus saccharophilus]|uniref:aspartate/glutamate racemase family protein n=1 Tax=Terribacillus saccharophilus TaxID=361277 RepID=UPI000BA4F614|nr:hypothetical protein [Terribacillus saccharophilus]PAF19110.1 hypothetical protein CHH51_04415 [Terribacillus saccharophilus]